MSATSSLRLPFGLRIRLKPWQKLAVTVAFLIVAYFFLPSSDTQNSPVVPSPSSAPSSSPSVLSASTSAEQVYPVTKVIDGDTIEVRIGNTLEKVRLIGVDTPETVDPRKPVQCFGKVASANTKLLLEHAEVKLVKDISERDRYGRLLRYVYKDDVFINELLVSDGYAQAKSYPPDIKFQDVFRAAEAQAKQAKKGLWADDACSSESGL